jgi:gliding motility-associated-like protein
MNSTSGGLTEVLLLVNSNASQFSWNVPFDTLHPQQIVVSSPGVYMVYGTNDFGCSATDSLSINGVDCNAEVPNVITPNGDGINDVLHIADAALHPFNKLIVLNRWGYVLFEAAPYLNNYSPTDLVDGTYFYMYYPNVLQKPLLLKQGFFMLFGE